jgi:hypothetical protein
MLAKSLTPDQWNAYWNVYVSMFGLNSLPENLPFFDALFWASSNNRQVFKKSAVFSYL